MKETRANFILKNNWDHILSDNYFSSTIKSSSSLRWKLWKVPGATTWELTRWNFSQLYCFPLTSRTIRPHNISCDSLIMYKAFDFNYVQHILRGGAISLIVQILTNHLFVHLFSIVLHFRYMTLLETCNNKFMTYVFFDTRLIDWFMRFKTILI